MDPQDSAPLSCRVAADTVARRGQDYLWHYEHGLFLMVLRRLSAVYGRDDLARPSEAFMAKHIGADGTIFSYRTDEFNLDQVNPGRVLFSFPHGEGTPVRRALETLKHQLDHQPRTPSGGYWHKKIYPDQMWLDGLYMAEPFSVTYGRCFNHPEAFDEAVSQFVLMERAARDPKTGLLYHAWDEARRQLWCDPATGLSPHFWGRAMGWYVMALVDVLDILPPAHPGVETLKAILNRAFEAARKVQDPESGLWYQILDLASRPGNYLESSASSMFAAAQAKAARKGWVEPGPARQSAWRAVEGLKARQMKTLPDGSLQLTGICSVAGLGGNPYRDGSFSYYISEKVVADDYKGVGPFLLALVEHEAWSDPAVASRLAAAEVPAC